MKTPKKPARKSKTPQPATPKRDLYAELSEPFPKGIWKFNPRTEMHSMNVVHRYDRLNKVLGVTGWSKQETITSIEPLNEFDDQERRYWMATAAVHIDLPGLGKGVFREGRGGHKNVDRGDAEKGAVSDAAGNALKDLVGKEAYLGQLDAPADEAAGQSFRPEKDGPPKNGDARDKFTSADGVITQLLEGCDGIWAQIDGWSCFIEKRLASKFSEKLLHVAHANAKWEMRGEDWIKVITGIHDVSPLPPMKTPAATR